ncbi:MAG: hypothetical protein AB7U44_03490 [Sulfuricurvum sp.]|uniref:hypothetical protein n=1 Tax=Sulfuricurvum sp. TaxID=2025608 RepID=UPI00260559D8|nr:hypothetical protein [Sulfuricurvum sp.]MDD2838221.1 hypothetical protein [Sulfuricurvum sp.]MDD3595040.1 hypothetical protein [Sulfuricurvum sp.]MDD4885216.1 hypothetical protein [Sulfuricurvum sp.]
MLRMFSWIRSSMRRFTEEKIIPYTFTLNDEPMLFRDMLKTNKMYQDGLKLEGNIPGFRMSIGRSYLVFIGLWHIIILPVSIAFHPLLAKIDCHLLILMAILFTGMFFATYAMFKEYLIDKVALRIIQNAWENHFPHFDYTLHAKEVAKIYSEALEKEVPHKNMQLYILDRLVEAKK